MFTLLTRHVNRIRIISTRLIKSHNVTVVKRSTNSPVITTSNLSMPSLIRVQGGRTIQFMNTMNFRRFTRPHSTLTHNNSMQRRGNSSIFLASATKLLNLVVITIQFTSDQPRLSRQIHARRTLISDSNFNNTRHRIIFINANFNRGTAVVRRIQYSNMPTEVIQ